MGGRHWFIFISLIVIIVLSALGLYVCASGGIGRNKKNGSKEGKK